MTEYMNYLAIDPGKGSRPSIGVAAWNIDCKLVLMEALTKNDFDRFFDAMENSKRFPSVVVLEDYIVRAGKNHTGSRVETVQLIGRIKDFCRRHSIKLVMQPSNILGIAHKWSGIPVPKGHLPDEKSAYLHGYYYLRKNHLIESRLFTEDGNAT